MSKAVLQGRGRVRSKAEFQKALEKIQSLRTLIREGLKVLDIQAEERILKLSFKPSIGENTGGTLNPGGKEGGEDLHQEGGEGLNTEGGEGGEEQEISFEFRVQETGQDEQNYGNFPEKLGSSGFKVHDIPGSPDLSSDSGFRFFFFFFFN